MIPIFWLWRDPWVRLALAVIAALLLAHSQMSASWIYPHYVAPAVGLFIAINIQCLRRLRVWQRERRWGLVLTRMIVIFAFLKLAPAMIDWVKPGDANPRQEVIAELAHDTTSRHLVITSYGSDYPVHMDWVYNAANIDAANIVWARDMGQEQNAELVEYFSNRKVWRWHLENDDSITLQEVAGQGSH